MESLSVLLQGWGSRCMVQVTPGCSNPFGWGLTTPCMPLSKTHSQFHTLPENFHVDHANKNIYSCLFLINGVKSCNFVPLGVNQGSHWLTSNNITCLLWQREQLANLVNAFWPFVSQLFLENKNINQSNGKAGGEEKHYAAFTIRKCPVSGWIISLYFY